MLVPNLNVEISDELLKAIRIRCAEQDVSQKDWVPRALAAALRIRAEVPDSKKDEA